MKKSFICTHEHPLHMQLNDEELLTISEIHLEGFLDGKDMLLLSKMSKFGNLSIVDMGGVTELNVSELYTLDDGMCTGNFIPFYENDKLEEVIFPNVETIDAQMFVECYNLRKVVIPKTLKKLEEEVLSSCPNIEEIYVPSNLCLPTSHYWASYFFPSYSFMGSGKRFVSDNEGWPDDMESISFFAHDGVLYCTDGGTGTRTYTCEEREDGTKAWRRVDCEIELYRYPAGDERTEFVIPDGVTHICKYAFFKNQHLKSVTISKSVQSFEENPFENCKALETIIYKHEGFRMFSTEDADNIGNDLGLKDLPSLKHIYLYAENPEDVCFDMFNALDNLGEVTLHVPRSCKKKYEDFDVEWYNGSVQKSYLRFNHIEEFDKESLG